MLAVIGFVVRAGADPVNPTRADSPLTFTRDIAPIVLAHCAPCHRPGESAPFDLLTYRDVRKHSRQIAEVVESRLMPPWLPEPGHGTFQGERRLSDLEIGRILTWVKEGCAEGNPDEMPPQPDWPKEWALGKPDLIVTLPEPYSVSAEGKDIYRNFVVPIPSMVRRYVKGVEFRPGNARVIHHAFIQIDETPFSRRLASKENPAGFDGMLLPETSRMPGGQFLGWQPGKRASFSPDGLGWVLNPGTDLVLQLHLHPSGRVEQVQPSIGFYFTEKAPTNQMVRLNLSQLFIDIPAGVSNYTIRQSYILPVDVQVVGINPHCHYLGTRLKGQATLPDGSRQPLLLIRNWDFNWQGDYRYLDPVPLPRGTRLEMEFSYDNSSHNLRNPGNPPRRVQYGLQTTDEMGELWFQVLARDAKDRSALLQDFHRQLSHWSLEYNSHLVRADPGNAVARTKVARAYIFLGRTREAMEHLHLAVAADPANDKAHYELGFIYLHQGDLTKAATEFETVIRLNPDDYEAQGSLGTIRLKQGDLTAAERHLREALRINPADAIARRNLGLVQRALQLRR